MISVSVSLTSTHVYGDIFDRHPRRDKYWRRALVSPLHGCFLCGQNVMLFLPSALIKLASHFCQFVSLMSASTLIFYILLACANQNLSCSFFFCMISWEIQKCLLREEACVSQMKYSSSPKVDYSWRNCGATLLRYWVLRAWIWMHYILIAAWLLAKCHSLILS